MEVQGSIEKEPIAINCNEGAKSSLNPLQVYPNKPKNTIELMFVGAINRTHEEEDQGPMKINNKGGKNQHIAIGSNRSSTLKQQKLVDLLGNKVTII